MFFRTLLIKYLNRKTDRQTLSNIAEAAAIPAYRHLLPRLNKEISRHRRFKRPLTVIAIGPNGNSSSQPNKALIDTPDFDGPSSSNNSGKLTQIEFILCGPIFRDAIREIDITAYDGANNKFVIALPETTKQQAMQTVIRLKNMVGEKVAEHLSVGVAEFPEDGLIIYDLLNEAIQSPRKSGS